MIHKRIQLEVQDVDSWDIPNVMSDLLVWGCLGDCLILKEEIYIYIYISVHRNFKFLLSTPTFHSMTYFKNRFCV